MRDDLFVGTSLTRRITVDRERTIDFMGDEGRVYATPSLIRDIEYACRDLIFERTPENEDSVGTSVSVIHMAPTLMDMDVEITVTVSGLEGRKVDFEITATDPLEQICKGRHQRFIVDVEQTRQRLLKKAAKVREG